MPAGTPGIGRVAAVSRARKGHDGSISLQTDELDLADGSRISVDIGRSGLRGRYAKRHVFPLVVPVPPVVIPAAFATRAGDLILDRGTAFDVRTVAPRPVEAPLVGGATPDPALAVPTPAPSDTGS